MITIILYENGSEIDRVYARNRTPTKTPCRYTIHESAWGKTLAEVYHDRNDGVRALAVKALQAIGKEQP